ncbi:MAG TPA: FAD-dependent oxidoreductase [Gaiellaceae bacterium]
MTTLDVAVVGAGPFGLSVAAHLPHRAVRVFGRPMETWTTKMPPLMTLRSAWNETSLSAPGDAGSIEEWAHLHGVERTGPIPLQTFLAYAGWFRERFVGNIDPSEVVGVERTRRGFAVATSSGDEVVARRVVVAVGITPFAYAPPPFRPFEGHAGLRSGLELDRLERLRDRTVVVLGGGQAALESAAAAADAGARVEVIARSPIRWFADREPDRPRSPLRQRLYRLAYPAVGYGPPPINRLVLHPDLFASLPAGVRRRLTARQLRPGASPWLRQHVIGRVTLTEGVTVTSVVPDGDCLELLLDDGSTRRTSELVLATGYRFDLRRLGFLARSLRDSLAVEDGSLVLDRHFRSTDPDLLFVGYPAEARFGPLSRFVLGTRFTATRAAEYLLA